MQIVDYVQETTDLVSKVHNTRDKVIVKNETSTKSIVVCETPEQSFDTLQEEVDAAVNAEMLRDYSYEAANSIHRDHRNMARIIKTESEVSNLIIKHVVVSAWF